MLAGTASAFATNFIKNAATTAGMATSSQRDLTKETLNCLRVLQRVLPVVFEPEFDSFENNVMWKREVVNVNDAVATEDARPQFVIDDEEDEEALAIPINNNAVTRRTGAARGRRGRGAKSRGITKSSAAQEESRPRRSNRLTGTPQKATRRV